MNGPALRELERIESRVLGALRPVDATTGATVRAALDVHADGARLVRNRSGLYVIHAWPPLAAHAAAFAAPPPVPAPASLALEVVVRDPAGRYLPRRARIALPRDPDAAGAASLFAPVVVPLYPSPTGALGTNWCALRVRVAAAAGDGTPGDALGGALLRVVAGGTVRARGLSDWRGEALVVVAGVPVTTWSEDADAVVITTLAATVEAVFDPALGTRTPPAEVAAGRAPNARPLVDPDALEARRATLPGAQQAVALAARAALHLDLTLELP